MLLARSKQQVYRKQQIHNPVLVLSCNEDVVEQAGATVPKGHSRPEQPQATSAAGNNDPRKDVLKSRTMQR